MIAVDAVRHVEHVMGTAVSFDVRTTDGDERHARQLIANACAVLHADDRTFSPWREDSAVSRVQRGELALWDAPADVIAVFDRCQHARRVSGGSFDPWTPDRRFDPTGLVKGWSAMRALHELEAAGITAAVVNAGGDIAAFGEPEPGRAWRFGIPDPADTARIRFAVEPPGAVATSGSDERGPHIYDPFGGAGDAAASATVTGPELDLADALATALIVAGTPGLELVDRIDATEACLVLADGTLRATRGFPFAT
jgi:thiamine biosynthesis lipoprotein